MKFIQRTSIFIALILLTILISTILPAQGYLHRTGKYIFDGDEKEVILRGIGTGNWMIQEGYMMQTSDVAGTQHALRAKLVSTIGEEKTDSFYTVWLDSHFREIDADSMKAWGFNSVRVALHYKWFTPPIEDEPVPAEITWFEKGFTMIDSLLEWCGKNEMYLILDLHGAPGGQGKDANISDYDPSKPSLWDSQLNKDKTVALWKKLAERYSEEPWIGGYDLINETNWTFSPAGNSQMLKLFKTITDSIRQVDKNHIIIIEGNSFANDYSGLTPPWDNNMIYSFHKYWNDYNQGSLDFALNIRNTHNVPIWLGETGENSNTWFTGTIALCEKNDIGWSWWPVKKVGINNPLRVTANPDYTQLVNYWKGSAAKPTVDNAFKAVLQFALNHRLENCTVQRDVIDAMFRQTTTSETIPYKIYNTGEPVFVVNYNLGKSGFAYYDKDTVNIGGASTVWNQGWSYRNDGVDIEACTDPENTVKYNVGWTADGEWMEYTIVADSTAAYTLNIRSASGGGGSKVHLEENGIAFSPLISLAGTGGWQTWKTTTVTGIILTKGTHKIRFVFDKGGSNLSYFKLSDPVAISDIPFTYLYSETSTDGTKILLSLNKPVTSAIGEINVPDFSVIIGTTPVSVSNIVQTGNPNIIELTLADTLYYGGIVKISYQGNNIQSSEQKLEQFSNSIVTNMLPLRFTLPMKIQAEDFAKNNGFVSESCSDAGEGADMGWAAPGDYLDYRVYVPQSKYYTLNFRVATTRASSKLIIRTGEGNTFKAVDTVEIKSTGDWQTWKTVPITVFLHEGRYTLRLFVLSGEFNTNWFQAVSASGVSANPVKSNDIQIFPNPASDFVNIELPVNAKSNYEISIYNSLGQVVKQIKHIEQSAISIGISDVKKGLYYVIMKNDNATIFTSKLIIQ